MKPYTFLMAAIIVLSAGVLSGPGLAAGPMQAPATTVSAPPATPADPGAAPAQSLKQSGNTVPDQSRDDENSDYDDEPFGEERVTIADPIEPFNRAMHHFNDKLYFWAIKPVARGYNLVVPEPARISVKNFFSNLRFPARLISCLLQADFTGAATETGRFAVNTLWGIGGLMDPSSGKELDLQKQDTDLGQTLGVYGVGHGFYIVWPVYGPSSPRDSVTIVGDQFMYPPSYFFTWYASLGIWSYEKVNQASLIIGEYESLVGAAIDPYVAIRDAYIQYRLKEVKARQARSMLFKNTGADPAPLAASGPEKPLERRE